MKPITSAENSHYKRWLRLFDSREVRSQRLTLAEGVHLAEAIHAARYPVESILIRRGVDRADVRSWIDNFTTGGAAAYELTAALFDRLSPVERGSGMLLVIPLPDQPTPASGDALFLDGVQDPGNAGALLRVAAAAGVASVLAAPNTVSLWSPKVLRGGQGAHFRLNLLENVAATTMRSQLPMPWFGAIAHGGTPLWGARLTQKAVGLMVGGEAAGLSVAALGVCDHQVTIPVASGVESLNVASAAAIFLFERQRQLELLRA